MPINPATGRRAKVTASTTWGSMEQARSAVVRYGLDGVGFVVGGRTRLAGVDLDGCVDPDSGAVADWAAEVLARLPDTYAERTVSGTGLRVFVRGWLPRKRRKRWQGVEAYTRKRFFTVSGDRLSDRPLDIRGAQVGLNWLHKRYLERSEPAGEPLPPASPLGLDDADVVRVAIGAANGPKFAKLWTGDAGDYPSPSEADLALCAILAFWTRGDAATIDRLFRSSGLMRAKWDRRVGDSTYGRLTIERAVHSRRGNYGLPRSPGRGAPRPDGIEATTSVTADPLRVSTSTPTLCSKSVPLGGRRDRPLRREAVETDAAVLGLIRSERVRRGRPVGFGMTDMPTCVHRSRAAVDRSVQRLLKSGRMLLIAPGQWRRLVAVYDLPEFVEADGGTSGSGTLTTPARAVTLPPAGAATSVATSSVSR